MKRFIPLIVTLFFVGCGVLYSPDIPVSTLKKTYANEHSKFIAIDGMEVHYRD